MMTQTVSTTLTSTALNGTVKTYRWEWQGQPVTVTYETVGSGQPVLLLPALSTVSSREEMAVLASRLAPYYQVFAIDWPGFGDSDRLRLDYGPDLYQQFLQDFVTAQFSAPVAVVAAGHAAGYALALQNVWSKLILVAPTWRGPLAVMGAPEGMRSGLRALVRSPIIGQALYSLNTQPAFLKWMYRRHVFVNEDRLTADYIAQRYQGTRQPGGRYAPAAFVTGGLDPARTRADFLTPIEQLSMPVMTIVGKQAPPSSKAEMEAIAALPNVQAVELSGTLGMAEEYGEDVATAVLPFLQAAK